MKIGKTYKIIGTLYIITQNNDKAREYFTLAYRIFEGKGMTKMMGEIEQKLKMIGGHKPINEPDEDAHVERPAMTIKSMKGKKKIKKKVIKV